MSEPFITNVNRGRYFLVGAAIGVAVLVIALVAVVVAYNFTNYKSTSGVPSGDTPPAQVAIGNPQKSAQLDAGESLLVDANAIGPDAFSSMELWVDGGLAGVQAAPSGGALPFSTFFFWLPKETGRHSLIAAAVDLEGLKTMSAQVVVFVNLDEGGGEILTTGHDVSPVVLPAPEGGGYVPPSAPGTDDLVGPANDWSGSLGDWFNSLTVDEKPGAPELVARAERCGVSLLIHDLSNNEEGFVVYRQTPKSPAWQQVIALSSQSQNNWLTYSDNGLTGAITYYVTAFNSQGETESNLSMVNVNPADCSGEPGVLTGITMEVTRLMPELAAEMSYCYLSTDGVNWTRWPQFGFLTPDEDGYVMGGPVVQILPNGFEGLPSIPRLNIFMECWGWQEGILVQLGDFYLEDMNPEFLGPLLVAGNGIQAEVLFDPVDIVKQGDFYPIGPETNVGSDFVLGGDQLEAQTWISPELPTPWLFQTTDPVACGWHVPTHAQNPAGRAFYCFVYPEFDPTQGSVSTQPYLIWTFGFDSTLDCLAGSGDDCTSYTELLTRAEETGGLVGFDVTSISNAGTFTWPVTEPKLTMFVVPPLDCTGDANYSVRLWYRPGPKDQSTYTIGEDSGAAADPDGSSFTEQDQPGAEPESPYATAGDTPVAAIQETYYGNPSNWVSIPCIPPNVNRTVEYEYHQYLDITFQTLELFELDDGDFSDYGAPQDVELFGYFKVVAPTMGQLLESEAPCFLPGQCNPEEPYLAYTRRYLNVADWKVDDMDTLQRYLESGFYDLRNWEVCQSTNKFGCLYEGQETAYLTNNNTIRVFVKEGDALSLEVRLIDYDDASENDNICTVSRMTPTRSLDEWGVIQNEIYMFHGAMTPSGRCTVQAVINAVTP